MIPNFIPIWAQNILMIVGAVALVLGFIKILFEIIPKLKRLRSDSWKYVAEKLKHRRLIKAAIASDIETHINEVVSDLQKELPDGWIKKASIEWVSKVDKDRLEEGELILRIKPLENQDENFLSGVYAFFSRALFPRTKDIIPNNALKAAILKISHRTISDKKPYLQQRFEDMFLETAVNEDASIAKYLGKYEKIDKAGFFTGTFLREIHEIATKARFQELRNRMNQEIDEILIHIEEFITFLQSEPRVNIPTESWSRVGPATSYAFLLVAHPRHQGVGRYLRQVQRMLTQNIERLYIMGAKEQEPFAKYVISEIMKLSGYELVEVFKINRDYRGTKGGIGALFVVSQVENQDEEG